MPDKFRRTTLSLRTKIMRETKISNNFYLQLWKVLQHKDLIIKDRTHNYSLQGLSGDCILHRGKFQGMILTIHVDKGEKIND